MEKWKTQVLPPDEENIRLAAELLNQGEVVGFPTETVYGLAASAYNPEAVAKFLRQKDVPRTTP